MSADNITVSNIGWTHHFLRSASNLFCQTNEVCLIVNECCIFSDRRPLISLTQHNNTKLVITMTKQPLAVITTTTVLLSLSLSLCLSVSLSLSLSLSPL